MSNIYKLPPKEDIYAEFDETIKEAAVALYGLTLEKITGLDLRKVDPGETLKQKALSIGCAMLAEIASDGNVDQLHLKDTAMTLNLAVLVAQAFRHLINGSFADYQVPGNHVPEGYADGLPQVENEVVNIQLNTAASE